MTTLPEKPRVRVPARTSVMARAEVETAYHAASTEAKDMATWGAWRISPDAALLDEIDTIVARSDDLARNNGIAAGAERTLVDNVVGPRILLKPNPDRIALDRDADWAADWSRIVESKWATFADTVWFDAAQKLTFHSATRLAFRTIVAAGEALALPLWLTNRGSKWNTALQLVDPARLSNPSGGMNTQTLRGGIEFDTYGAPIAYNVRRAHPGDVMLGSFIDSGSWERIPAYLPWGRLRVIHAYEPDRIGQSRGKALITAVARQFKMADHMFREKLRTAVLDAMIFATLETPLGPDAQADLFGGDAAALGGRLGLSVDQARAHYDNLAARKLQMQGGTLLPLPVGTKMNPFTPNRPAGELEAWSTNVFRQVGAGMNVGRHLLLKDFSDMNYSSARSELLEAWRYFYSCRQMLADTWSSPIFELWFEEAVNRGEIPDCTPDDFYANRIAWTRCKWICAGRGWVDPVKEADAAAIRIDNGFSTLEDECAEQARDWRDVLEQQQREAKMRKELGLSDPKGPARQPVNQQEANAA